VPAHDPSSPVHVQPAEASGGPPALDVRGVTHEYRGRAAHRALDAVSLCVSAGEAVALLGPNGSGKSTLLKLICDALPVRTGSIAVSGCTASCDRRAALGAVLQAPCLDPHLTVMENLRFQGALYGVEPAALRSRILDALTRAGLLDRGRSKVKTLSGGLARRVDLIRATLHQPRLLLLDEPTAGLDPVARESFLADLFERVRSGGLTVLVSTHLVDEAERCDRVCIMHEGRIVADDSPHALKRAVGARSLRVFGEEDPTSIDRSLTWRRHGREWKAVIEDESNVDRIVGLLSKSARSFSIAPPTLADAFEQRTGAGLDVEESGVPSGEITR
jgi:ABC-2 type transport system ATP-binding protein